MIKNKAYIISFVISYKTILFGYCNLSFMCNPNLFNISIAWTISDVLIIFVYHLNNSDGLKYP